MRGSTARGRGFANSQSGKAPPSVAGLLQGIEHGLGRNVLPQFRQIRIVSLLDAEPVGDRAGGGQYARDLVLRQQVDLQIETSRRSAASAARFCVISTKVDRKMASTDATVARMTNVGSNGATVGIQPRLIAIQTATSTTCNATSVMLPAKRVITAATPSCTPAFAAASSRLYLSARMFLPTSEFRPGSCRRGGEGVAVGTE